MEYTMEKVNSICDYIKSWMSSPERMIQISEAGQTLSEDMMAIYESCHDGLVNQVCQINKPSASI